MPRQSSSKGAGPSTSKPKAGSKKPNPGANNTNADVKKLKAELEKCIREVAAQKEKNEKLITDHAEEIEELEQSKLAKKQEVEDDLETFEKETNEECSKRTAHLEETREHERLIPMQEELDVLRVVSVKSANQLNAFEQGLIGGPWQFCEWCQRQWAQTGDRVPRILDCGHTMCERCVIGLQENGLLECPVDLSITSVTAELPKNYALLHT